MLWGENVTGKSSDLGKGDSTCGREVVYTIPEIKVLLRSTPDDAQRWLTTSQMGWAPTRERNEITNEKGERDGKPVARQLAPMISQFIKAQWESPELECMDDERRQILEEAALQRSSITYGVQGRRRRSRPTILTSGLSNHP